MIDSISFELVPFFEIRLTQCQEFPIWPMLKTTKRWILHIYNSSLLSLSSNSAMISISGKSPPSTFLPRKNSPLFAPGASKYLAPLNATVPSVLPTGSSNMTPTQCPPPPTSSMGPKYATVPRLDPGCTWQRECKCGVRCWMESGPCSISMGFSALSLSVSSFAVESPKALSLSLFFHNKQYFHYIPQSQTHSSPPHSPYTTSSPPPIWHAPSRASSN